jgi:N-acetyl sugar amidotransferase
MKKCVKCLIPETHEATSFDENGVCSVCKNIENKEVVDWEQRGKELRQIAQWSKGQGKYDCIIPASFGKDSAFTLLYACKDLGLNPLVVCCNHGFMRPNVMENRRKAQEILNFDILDFTVDREVVKKLMRESLRRTGDWCYPCHLLVFALPMHIANWLNVPMVVWGESSMEYTSHFEEAEEVDKKRFDTVVNLGLDLEEIAESAGIPMSKLWMMQYPDFKGRSICLGNYIKWDTRDNVRRIKEEIDWTGDQVDGIPPEYDYEKVECKFQGMRDYCIYKKKGFGRTAHLVAIDLRNDRIEKEPAQELIDKYDGVRPSCMDEWLDYVGITEQEYEEIMEGL